MSRVVLEGGQVITNVHSEVLCEGRSCPVHSRTNHSMRVFPQNFREDTGVMERLCTHGIGHPDPDGFPYMEMTNNNWMKIHGCDGCCHPSTESSAAESATALAQSILKFNLH